MSFVRHKDDLEDDVALMTKAMEIAAKASVDFDGKTPLQVGAWRSDRDSNLTSDRAVADMLASRIEHRLTAADAKNQTPHLDNAMRQVIEMARVVRIDSGLPVEFWEFAVRFAVMTINRIGVGKGADALGRSPMTRWTGRASSIDGWHVFGSEAFPEQKSHERADGKMGAVAPGGDGRWRYLGPDCGPGFVSSGHRIIDTVPTGGGPPRVRVRKNCKFNEDMASVRMLPFPAPAWDVDEGEEWFQDAEPKERPEGEEAIDRDKELQDLFDEQLAKKLAVSDEQLAVEGEPRVSEDSEERKNDEPSGTTRVGARRSKRSKRFSWCSRTS